LKSIRKAGSIWGLRNYFNKIYDGLGKISNGFDLELFSEGQAVDRRLRDGWWAFYRLHVKEPKVIRDCWDGGEWITRSAIVLNLKSSDEIDS
jgi:hypothetical protein